MKYRKDCEIIYLLDIPKKIYYHVKINKESRLLLFFMFYFLYIKEFILTNLGFMLSYQLYYKYSALKTGDPSYGMVKSQYIHIHHWLYCFIFLMVTFYLEFKNYFLIGLCCGGIAHGIQYADWYQILL